MATHLIAALKAGAALTPVGSAVVTAINEYIPSAHDKAVQRAAEALRGRLNDLATRLEQEFVRTDQFADLFKNCVFICQRTQHEEKLRAAANIITNALLRQTDEEKLAYEELDHFVRCVENLSIGAIRVLMAAIDYAMLQEQGHKPSRVGQKNKRVDFGALRGCLPAIDDDLLMGLLGELVGLHLMHSLGSPSVRFERYTLYPFETTPLGFRFLKYVLEPGEKPKA